MNSCSEVNIFGNKCWWKRLLLNKKQILDFNSITLIVKEVFWGSNFTENIIMFYKSVFLNLFLFYNHKQNFPFYETIIT